MKRYHSREPLDHALATRMQALFTLFAQEKKTVPPMCSKDLLDFVERKR